MTLEVEAKCATLCQEIYLARDLTAQFRVRDAQLLDQFMDARHGHPFAKVATPKSVQVPGVMHPGTSAGVT
jgi:hypothetical protein